MQLTKLSLPLAMMAMAHPGGATEETLNQEELDDLCPPGALNCNLEVIGSDAAVGGALSKFDGLLFNTARFALHNFSVCPNWRVINGECNNIVHQEWGTVGEIMPRSVTAGTSTTNAGSASVYDSDRWKDYGGGSTSNDPTNPTTGNTVGFTNSAAWGGHDPRYVSDKACRTVVDWENDGGTGTPAVPDVPNDATRSDAVITYAQVMDHELDATGPVDHTDGNTVSNEAPDSGVKYDFGSGVSGGISGKLERTNNLAKNGITSYVDAGIVYGEDEPERNNLREVDGLKYTCLEQTQLHGTCGVGAQYLPTSKEICDRDFDCKTTQMFMANPTKRSCFYAGDFRANENPALLAFHTLFARMHNYIDGQGFTDTVSECTCSSSWDGGIDNSTCRFETIRHRVGYEEQFITYDEWLPAYTGTWSGGSYSQGSTTALTFSTTGVGGMPAYGGYNTAIRGSVRHIFATATFRQHTGVNHTMKLASAGDLELDQTYFESCVWVGNTGPGCTSQQADATGDSDVTSHGIENLCEIMVGQVQQLAKRGDTVMLTEQRNQLFYKASGFGNTKEDSNGNVRPNGEGNDGACIDPNNSATCNTASHNGTIEGIGGDLATLNMFRGRDHEISGYKDAFNAYFTASAPATPGDIHTYDGLGANGVAGTIDLSNAYTTMNAVDLWTGALGEAKLGNAGTGVSMLGAILTFDVVTQFRDLRDGDRFFYQNTAAVTQTTSGIDTYGAPAFCGSVGGLGLKHWIETLTGARGLGVENAFKVNVAAGCEGASGVTKVHDLWNTDLKCGSGIQEEQQGYKGSGVNGNGEGEEQTDEGEEQTDETQTTTTTQTQSGTTPTFVDERLLSREDEGMLGFEGHA